MAKGFEESLALFDRLEGTARAKLAELLAEFGVEVSAAQKAAVARQTGHLAAGLGVDLLIDRLRVRIGLLSLKSGRNSRYYGRFVEFGRRAQTVRVIRGTAASKRSATSKRKRAGGEDPRKAYTLRVKPMAARPFVYLPGVDDRLVRRTADFWNEVLGA